MDKLVLHQLKTIKSSYLKSLVAAIQTCKAMLSRYFVYKTLLLIDAPLVQEVPTLKHRVCLIREPKELLLNAVLAIIKEYRMGHLAVQP